MLERVLGISKPRKHMFSAIIYNQKILTQEVSVDKKAISIKHGLNWELIILLENSAELNFTLKVQP